MSRRNRREALTPDLTPLIDVVFLLLIFFMVSSVFKKEELALLLTLPKTEQGKGDSKLVKQITIELSKESIAINGKVVTIEELEDQIKGVDKKSLINLRADGEVEYARIIKIFGKLNKYKLSNISLITEKESE